MGQLLISVITATALAAGPLVSGPVPDGLRGRLDPIVKRQQEARQRFSKDLGGGTTEEARKPIEARFQAETDQNTREVLDLVRANPDDAAVVEALKFVIMSARAGPGDESYRAMEILRDHVRDPGMGDLCGRIFYFVHAPAAGSLLRSVLQQHPDRIERGLACHSLATYLGLQARMVRRIREEPARIDEYVHERHKGATGLFVRGADPEALEKESEMLLERVVAEFADVKDWYDNRPIGVIAGGELFAARHLAVGKFSPEVTGHDHEGKPFAMGDYRGKVVVLAFSGNWCGPCVGMYPQERELVARLKGKPFAMVGVNTDEDVETLKKSIASGEITWRCWWDGGTTGPITTRWGISSFPSIFVLDKAGVIRFKDPRGEDLEKAVASLLDEAPSPR